MTQMTSRSSEEFVIVDFHFYGAAEAFAFHFDIDGTGRDKFNEEGVFRWRCSYVEVSEGNVTN